MKSQKLFRAVSIMVLLVSFISINQPAHASTSSVDKLDIQIIDRNLEYWDTTYIGYVSSSIYENWGIRLTEYRNFIVTVSPVAGDLIPLLILIDANGNELTRGIGTITGAQPAGDYSILIQPQIGEGFYSLLLRDVSQTQPITTTLLNPSSLNVSKTAVATVSLNNVPAEGYTSAEFTCLYDSAIVEVSNIVVSNRFGPDPSVAINESQNNSFIVALAGSRGDKATTSGAVFTFDLKGLQTGYSTIECTARVSKGDNVLVDLPSIGSRLTILGNVPTPTPSPATCNQAEFIADINVPPGTVMSPNVTFTKTWRLMNVGTCAWTTSYQLVFFSGEQMNVPSPLAFPISVEPGEAVDISLEMTAPSIAGSYQGNWMFKNANGALFGIGPQANEPFSVDIIVSGATATPSASTHSPTPSVTPIPSITPGGPTATPIAGIAFDFAANVCTAVWFSGAGQLPCPGIDGDPKGFVLKLNNPILETGVTDTRPGLLTFPQNVQNGYIQGFYPPFHVQSGDRFRSIIGCEFGATNCYLAFRLDYQIGSDPIKTFWGPFLERYEGQYYSADVDLSSLAGSDVKFILTLLSAGSPLDDRALWVNPIISRVSVVSTPIPSATPTMPTLFPSATPAGNLLLFTDHKYGFQFMYPIDSQIATGNTDNDARINLPFVSGTNVHTNLQEKYLQVNVQENQNPCVISPIIGQSSSQPENVTINNIQFSALTGSESAAGNHYDWVSYATTHNHACITLAFVLHSVDPGNFSTPPPVFDKSAESMVFAQIISTFTWLTLPGTAIPTFVATPTLTATPAITLTPFNSPTSDPQIFGTLSGQVLSNKQSNVSLFDANNRLVISVDANPDGTYNIAAPAGGTYTVIVTASGYLKTQGFATITTNTNTTMSTITLLAGDIDENNVIDQFDAMTIGMSYNSTVPSAADLNNDGIINVLDLELLAKNYRKTGPVVWQ